MLPAPRVHQIQMARAISGSAKGQGPELLYCTRLELYYVVHARPRASLHRIGLHDWLLQAARRYEDQEKEHPDPRGADPRSGVALVGTWAARSARGAGAARAVITSECDCALWDPINAISGGQRTHGGRGEYVHARREQSQRLMAVRDRAGRQLALGLAHTTCQHGDCQSLAARASALLTCSRAHAVFSSEFAERVWAPTVPLVRLDPSARHTAQQ